MADIPLFQKRIYRILSHPGLISLSLRKNGRHECSFYPKPLSFHVDYYGASFSSTLRSQRSSVEVFDSFNLSTDIDEVSDLAEVLIHGKGHSKTYLEKIGVNILANKGRVGVERL